MIIYGSFVGYKNWLLRGYKVKRWKVAVFKVIIKALWLLSIE